MNLKRDPHKEEKCISEEATIRSSALFAIRAPPDSKIHIPRPVDPADIPAGISKEEYDELIGYLNKKYQLSIDAGGGRYPSHLGSAPGCFDNVIQVYRIKSFKAGIQLNHPDVRHSAAASAQSVPAIHHQHDI